jgi:hypothetical protein
MKKQITRALLGFGMLLMLVASASAQTARRIEIQIPFDFVAGHTHMQAGRYTVRRVSSESETALLIQSEDGRKSATLITNAGGEMPERAQVVFRQYGEQYFLAEVSLPGTSSVRIAPKTKEEKRLERGPRIASESGEGADKTVTVAASIQ